MSESKYRQQAIEIVAKAWDVSVASVQSSLRRPRENPRATWAVTQAEKLLEAQDLIKRMAEALNGLLPVNAEFWGDYNNARALLSEAASLEGK